MIKDMGHANFFFLGIKIARSSAGLLLSQSKYATDLIQDAGLTTAKPDSSPLPKGLKLNNDTETLLPDPEQY